MVLVPLRNLPETYAEAMNWQREVFPRMKTVGSIARKLGISVLCVAAARYGLDAIEPLVRSHASPPQRPIPTYHYEMPHVEIPAPPKPVYEVLPYR